MKPVLFHSINLPQQEEREKKSVWLMIQWTQVFLYKWRLIQEFSCSIRCPRRADARVRLNGRKRRRPGSLQRVLNSEVGDFSSLQSLRFNCSECSWRRVTACTDRRMTAWQVYRGEERMVKWRPGQKIIYRDYLTCLWNTSRLSLTYTLSPQTDC